MAARVAPPAAAATRASAWSARGHRRAWGFHPSAEARPSSRRHHFRCRRDPATAAEQPVEPTVRPAPGVRGAPRRRGPRPSIQGRSAPLRRRGPTRPGAEARSTAAARPRPAAPRASSAPTRRVRVRRERPMRGPEARPALRSWGCPSRRSPGSRRARPTPAPLWAATQGRRRPVRPSRSPGARPECPNPARPAGSRRVRWESPAPRRPQAGRRAQPRAVAGSRTARAREGLPTPARTRPRLARAQRVRANPRSGQRQSTEPTPVNPKKAVQVATGSGPQAVGQAAERPEGARPTRAPGKRSARRPRARQVSPSHRSRAWWLRVPVRALPSPAAAAARPWWARRSAGRAPAAPTWPPPRRSGWPALGAVRAEPISSCAVGESVGTARRRRSPPPRAKSAVGSGLASGRGPPFSPIPANSIGIRSPFA